MLRMRSIIPAVLAGLLLGTVPSSAAISVTARHTDPFFFLYRQNIGPYSHVDRSLAEVRKFTQEKGLEGPLIGIYHDNPVRTAPALQRSELGMPLSREAALRLAREAQPDTSEEALIKQMQDERGVALADSYYVRIQPGSLVATARVREAFGAIPKVYEVIQTWIWNHDYYVIGPVIEIYRSPVAKNKLVDAEVQIGIERTGVPDRR